MRRCHRCQLSRHLSHQEQRSTDSHVEKRYWCQFSAVTHHPPPHRIISPLFSRDVRHKSNDELRVRHGQPSPPYLRRYSTNCARSFGALTYVLQRVNSVDFGTGTAPPEAAGLDSHHTSPNPFPSHRLPESPIT